MPKKSRHALTPDELEKVRKKRRENCGLKCRKMGYKIFICRCELPRECARCAKWFGAQYQDRAIYALETNASVYVVSMTPQEVKRFSRNTPKESYLRIPQADGNTLVFHSVDKVGGLLLDENGIVDYDFASLAANKPEQSRVSGNLGKRPEQHDDRTPFMDFAVAVSKESEVEYTETVQAIQECQAQIQEEYTQLSSVGEAEQLAETYRDNCITALENKGVKHEHILIFRVHSRVTLTMPKIAGHPLSDALLEAGDILLLEYSP